VTGEKKGGRLPDLGRSVGDERAIPLAEMVAFSGIDTSVCEFCEQPLDDSEPWRRGLDGCGAHERCLGAWL
jgi:hypothetical protein